MERHAISVTLADHFLSVTSQHNVEYNGSHVRSFTTDVPHAQQARAESVAALLATTAADTDEMWSKALSEDWFCWQYPLAALTEIYNTVSKMFDTIAAAWLVRLKQVERPLVQFDGQQRYRSSAHDTYVRCLRDFYSYLIGGNLEGAREALLSLALATRAMHAYGNGDSKKQELAAQQCAALAQRAGCALQCLDDDGKVRTPSDTSHLHSFRHCYMPALLWPGLQMVALAFSKLKTVPFPEDRQLTTTFDYVTSAGPNARSSARIQTGVYKFSSVGSFFWWVCCNSALEYDDAHSAGLSSLFFALAAMFYDSKGDNALSLLQHMNVKKAGVPDYWCCSTTDGRAFIDREDGHSSRLAIDAFVALWLKMVTDVGDTDVSYKGAALIATLNLWPMLQAADLAALWTRVCGETPEWATLAANSLWRTRVIEAVTNIPVLPMHFTPQMHVDRDNLHINNTALELHKLVLFGEGTDGRHEILLGGFDNHDLLGTSESKYDAKPRHYTHLLYNFRVACKFSFYWLPAICDTMVRELLSSAAKRGVRNEQGAYVVEINGADWRKALIAQHHDDMRLLCPSYSAGLLSV